MWENSHYDERVVGQAFECEKKSCKALHYLARLSNSTTKTPSVLSTDSSLASVLLILCRKDMYVFVLCSVGCLETSAVFYRKCKNQAISAHELFFASFSLSLFRLLLVCVLVSYSHFHPFISTHIVPFLYQSFFAQLYMVFHSNDGNHRLTPIDKERILIITLHTQWSICNVYMYSWFLALVSSFCTLILTLWSTLGYISLC